MRRLISIAALVLGCALAGCATPPPETDDVEAAVRRVDAAFASDAELAAEMPSPLMAVRAGQPRFVDRIFPFGWDTAGPWFDAWRGVAGRKAAILRFRHVTVDGRWASAVTTARLDYVRNGEAKHETGTQLFLMSRQTGAWRLEGYAWFGACEVASGAEAKDALAGARKLIDRLNAAYVIPRKFVDHGAIEDNSIDDWPVIGETPQHEAQTHGPVAPGDPDAMFVLGAPECLALADGGAYVLFPATLASRSGGPVKGTGRLVLALTAMPDFWRGLGEPWTYFDEIAWAPD
jgi:hypothetical protein